jgi:hypothetical protein
MELQTGGKKGAALPKRASLSWTQTADPTCTAAEVRVSTGSCRRFRIDRAVASLVSTRVAHVDVEAKRGQCSNADAETAAEASGERMRLTETRRGEGYWRGLHTERESGREVEKVGASRGGSGGGGGGGGGVVGQGSHSLQWLVSPREDVVAMLPALSPIDNVYQLSGLGCIDAGDVG